MRFAVLPLLLLATTPALAQNPAELMACVRITGDAERLACYDRAMLSASPEARAASEKRAAEGAVVAAAAAKAKAEADAIAKREAFGAETVATRPNRFATSPEDVQEIETGISEVLTNTSGLGVFLLENGQLWKQADTSRLPNVRAGDRVTLSRAGFGGYHLNFVKQKLWVLVKRMK